MPVNIENMTKWVEALESGEFEQGRNRLATIFPDGKVKYCCLGVACEVAKANGVNLEVDDQEGDECGARFYNGSSGTLPDEVVEWLGLPEFAYNPAVSLGGLRSTAAGFNDSNNGYDFPAIAAAIRQEFLVNA